MKNLEKNLATSARECDFARKSALAFSTLPMAPGGLIISALVQTRAESAMMNKCHDSFLSKSCSKVGTLTRRSWCADDLAKTRQGEH
jgi:hypothetical protein